MNPFQMLRDGAHLAISFSGGKDSDAMMTEMIRLHKREGWTGKIHVVHADLGRAEWRYTPAYVEEAVARRGLPLHVVRHTKRDLLAGIQQRMITRPDAPPWPSPKNRYCTSDWKRSVISRWIRNQFPADAVVICAMGLRADESPARAKRPSFAERTDCMAPTKNRAVYDWLPIHQWSEKWVWESFMDDFDIEGFRSRWQDYKRINGDDQDGFIQRVRDTIGYLPCHPAYMFGNERLSCALCIMGSVNDILNGIEQDHELYSDYCQIEIDSGYSFRQKLWLGSLRPDLLTAEQRNWYQGRNLL